MESPEYFTSPSPRAPTPFQQINPRKYQMSARTLRPWSLLWPSNVDLEDPSSGACTVCGTDHSGLTTKSNPAQSDHGDPPG